MNIGIIGHSNVGSAIGKNLVKFANEITYGLRDKTIEEKLTDVIDTISGKARFDTIKATILNNDIIFIAIPGHVVEDFVKDNPELDGKVIVDCTNPIGEGFSHFYNSTKSNTQVIQELLPSAKVVKSFSTYGFENFADSSYRNYKEVKPAMLIAGNDSGAKKIVSEINNNLGFETVDTGDVSMAIHLEHQAFIWIKMARVQGRDFDFTWALLKR